ncbi:MAG TPA: VOC family protein [Candidatus Acidoferrum sp.]|jgi:catechol 2,3-dioxygenase-like lactoylglutathione lyase family enzyme|nr:VOC family protein [Candidatus Acidoferrum sp.]
MAAPLSRRLFLALTGGALVAPAISVAASEVPELLDHMILGCSDLDRGIAFVEDRTGVRAAFGGVHPGRGTRNALLSLGGRRYLEIMAPDPDQPDAKDALALHLRKLSEPQIVGWAAHPGDLGSFAKKLREGGVAFEGPSPGSRKRPDGRVLQWQTLTLKENPYWLLPFFIEWSANSLHPSADAPPGCRLIRFEAVTPEPDKLAKTAALLSLDVAITKGAKPQLRATIAGPKADLSAAS